jgi:nitrogen fixation NifU-like protein
MFSGKLLDHFQNPRNTAEIEAPDATAEVENPVCGDVLRIALRLEQERIGAISFRARGCVPAMACGSAVTELARGRSVEEARRVTVEQVIEQVGGLPAASGHAAQLAVQALRKTLDAIR